MKGFLEFCKREFVLVASVALAIVSLFLVPPDATYASYIDWRTIAILFCLMAVVQAFVASGLFSWLSEKIVHGVSSVKMLSLLLVMTVFFSSMLVTNDVSLLTFVPFTMMVYPATSRRDLRFTVVMETIAANLGSMVFPFGNPQNLYLYSFYNLSFSAFFSAVLPLTLVSLALLILLVWFHHYEETVLALQTEAAVLDKKKLKVTVLLFILAILTVLRLVDWRMTLVVILVSMLIVDPSIFRRVDYCLLLTFAAFFVFVGNLSRLPVVTEFLTKGLSGHEYWYGVLCSQVISNVPAAILLSRFSSNGIALVLGTDVGGLGTLIASLASLISFKAYAKGGDSKGKYLLSFTLWNVAFLAVLSVVAMLLFR